MSSSKTIILVADNDNLIKPTITIQIFRRYPKGRRYTIKSHSGWSTDRFPKFYYRHCTKAEVLEILEEAKAYFEYDFIAVNRDGVKI